MEKNQIFVQSGTDYKQMTRELLERSRLEDLIADRNLRIGIKPNMVSASHPSSGATTHGEILAGIIEYLQEKGFFRLLLLEGSWVGEKTMDVFHACGYQEICQRYQVPFHDTQKDKSFAADCSGMELHLCSSVREIDFLINVPVMKGHCQTKITCALKNMKGLIPNSEKRRFHSLGLHKPIAHLNTAIRQDFIVVDQICGDLDFEDGGNPVVMNRIFTGRDPVLIDAYVCDLMHYQISEVPYLELAGKLGAGCSDVGCADIQVFGEETETRLPKSRKVVEVADAVEEIESCSACYGYLIPALDRLKQEGLLEQLSEKIHIGQGFRGKTGELGIGHCTRGFAHSLEGCPPMEDQVYRFLKDYIEHHQN